MSKTSNNLIIYNGYPLSVVVAVLLHSVVLATLLYLQGNSSSEALELVQPTVITALFLDENPQIRNEQNIERRRADDQRREREEAQRQEQLEAQRQQEELEEQERIEEANRLEEERLAEIRREETAQREAEELASELERQREADLERQREQERQDREEQDRQEQERLRELADAEAQRQAEAAAEGARTELQLVQSATGLIQQIVEESWSRPPSARNGMRAILRIQMVPTGEVTEATIIESSGDAAFDRSAENAVFRAAPFTELQALPIRLFNQNFRTLQLVFQPEDLLN